MKDDNIMVVLVCVFIALVLLLSLAIINIHVRDEELQAHQTQIDSLNTSLEGMQKEIDRLEYKIGPTPVLSEIGDTP